MVVISNSTPPGMKDLFERAKYVAALLGSRHSDIQAVFLFGSVLNNSVNALSDIDLGVVLNPSSLLSIVDLFATLAKYGLEENVDVVIVPKEDVLLRHHIVKGNCILYKQPDFDATALVVAALRDYEAHRPLFNMIKQKVKDRYSHGAK